MSRVDELLSENVRKYPAVYDKTTKEFKDRNISNLIWAKIGKQLNLKSGAETRTKFRNLRKRYSKAKKDFSEANKSGTGHEEVDKMRKNLDKYNFMKWLDRHVQQRKSKTNVSDDSDDEECGSVNYSEGNDSPSSDDDDASVTDPNIGETNVPIVTTSNIEEENLPAEADIIFKVDARGDALFEKPIDQLISGAKDGNKKGAKGKRVIKKKTKFPRVDKIVDEEERLFIKSLADKVEDKSKDEFDIFGELIASKMRSLSKESQEEAEMAITNTLMHCRIKDRRMATSFMSTMGTQPQYARHVYPPHQQQNPTSIVESMEVSPGFSGCVSREKVVPRSIIPPENTHYPISGSAARNDVLQLPGSNAYEA